MNARSACLTGIVNGLDYDEYNPATDPMIEAHYDNPEAMKEIGINYAAQQIIDLITNGVDGIHIYTMNRAETAQRVFDSIPAVLKELN